MNSADTAPVEHSPLPLTQFKRFVAVFHVVFIGGLVFCLLLRWRQPGVVWSWHDLAIIALVVGQIDLYCRFLVVPWSPQVSYRTWCIYFAVSLEIWLVEWRLERSLQWTACAYLGQMFGILPPRYSLPASFAVLATYFGIQLEGK